MALTSRKPIFGFACFDFANSAFGTLIGTFIYSTFFAAVIACDEIAGTTQWGYAVSGSFFALALLSPILGAVADAYGWKRRLMALCIVTCCACSALLFLPQKGDVFLALGLFFVGNLAVELAIVFNNAFLPEIASKETQGRVSGLAWGFGYVGGLLCLTVALIGFVQPETPWFGLDKDSHEHIRATNVLVAVWFAVFSIPTLLWLKSRKKPRSSDGLVKIVRSSFSRLGDTFSHLRRHQQLFWLFLARLFYNDGIVTLGVFGGIYAKSELGFEMSEVLMLGIVMNVAAGLGSFVFGFIDDRIGARNTIAISVVALTISTTVAIAWASAEVFWICAGLIGFFFGPNQSSSRSFVSRLVPPEKEGEFFGLFAFSGKLTAFLGPLLVAQLTDWFGSIRIGMAVVPILFVVGLMILMGKVKSDR